MAPSVLSKTMSTTNKAPENVTRTAAKKGKKKKDGAKNQQAAPGGNQQAAPVVANKSGAPRQPAKASPGVKQ